MRESSGMIVSEGWGHPQVRVDRLHRYKNMQM